MKMVNSKNFAPSAVNGGRPIRSFSIGRETVFIPGAGHARMILDLGNDNGKENT